MRPAVAVGESDDATLTRAALVHDLRTSHASKLGLDATAAHVREKLLVFANRDRMTFVSVETLASAINRSEKTVRRALRRLAERGEVTWRTETTWWGRRNVYTLASRHPVAPREKPVPATTAMNTEPGPSHVPGQDVPKGEATVTRPPRGETLLRDRDQRNAPPYPPRPGRERSVVVDLEQRRIEENVLVRWRTAKLPELNEHRARLAISRRLAEGVSEHELVDAVDGAVVRSKREGWANVASAFAVVVSCAADVHEYARQGRAARLARERRILAERERRALDFEAEKAVDAQRPSNVRAAMAAAAAGRFDLAAQLARELENDGEAKDGSSRTRSVIAEPEHPRT
jgi:hypothetical protein